MAYPPSPPPNTRVNTTPMVDNHPSDHNLLADAISDILSELGSDPKGDSGSVDERFDDVAADVAPVGSIVMFAGAASPSGRWAKCIGQAQNRTGEFAALFGVIGTAYGSGNGTTTFNLPDFRSRGPVGTGLGDDEQTSSGVEFSLGQKHGLKHTTLPSHTHKQTAHQHKFDHTHTTSAIDAGMKEIKFGGKTWGIPLQSTGGKATGFQSAVIPWNLSSNAASFAWAGIGQSGVPNLQVRVPQQTTSSPDVVNTEDGGSLGAKAQTESQGESPNNRNYAPSLGVDFYIRY